MVAFAFVKVGVPALSAAPGDNAQQSLAGHIGLYEFADRSAVYVGQIIEVPELLSVELANSRIRALHPRGASAFFTGPTAGASAPVQSEIEFTAKGLTWRESGAVREAQRITYRTEDIRFKSNGVELFGTLTFPNRPPPYAAAVFAHGSGGQNRDFFYATPLFVRRGVAVLTFDKRGVGTSTGNWRTASIADLAEDIVAGARFLQGRADIRKDRVGVYGSSEGGWVAPLAASNAPELLSFVIARSASGLVDRENIIYEIEGDLRANGFGNAEVAAMQALHRQEIAVVRANGAGWSDLRASLARAALQPWFKLARLPAAILEDIPANKSRIASWLAQEQRNWIDPAGFWPHVRCPVLVQNGLIDRNVPTTRSFEIIANALARGGNKAVTLNAYPNGDHGLFQSKSGYASDIPNTQGFVPGYLRDLEGWIDANVVR